MHKLEMTVNWVVATPLNIAGAPGENPLVDTPLLGQYRAGGSKSQILLPASTIKGKLRSEAERLLRTFRPEERLCQGRRAEAMCPAYWWDKNTAPPDNICLLCRLFGSPWQPATLQFSDVTARVGHQLLESDATVVRPGVGLSRVRGTGQEDLLFFVETTPALEDGVTFAQCRIEGVVPDERSAAVLWAAVQQVVAFGNGRSRGRGWLKARDRVIEIKIEEQVWNPAKIEAVWRGWLGLATEGGDSSG